MPQGNPIYFRRGDAALWLSVDPILDEGEPGWESDTGLYKTGNGIDVWSDLPYDPPSAHAATHGFGGADAITIEPSQVTGLNSFIGDVQTALPNKSDVGHTHVATDVTDITTFVDGRISLVVDGAPLALDTLNELAAALGDDANFAGTVTTALAGKAPTVHTHTLSQITDYVPPVVTLSNTFMLMGA